MDNKRKTPPDITLELQKRLSLLAENAYADFTRKLVPDTAYPLLGVRLPALRALAREYAGDARIDGFLADLPHTYLDENTLHAFIINREKRLPESIKLLDAFLPYVDSWSTCDSLRPAAIEKHFSEAKPYIFSCIESGAVYTVRFGILMLMLYGLKDGFDIGFHERVCRIESGEYYVNMMRAWYFATALAFRYDETLPVLIERRLDEWTHNKTIQKAVESRRITDERKAFLRTLRRKRDRKRAKSGEGHGLVGKMGYSPK